MSEHQQSQEKELRFQGFLERNHVSQSITKALCDLFEEFEKNENGIEDPVLFLSNRLIENRLRTRE